ncbi:hypothetical protein C357_06704 [Citreicella sp. 357]|nr:hypothetical protein C357_06704 [Citreicella sp. 357]
MTAHLHRPLDSETATMLRIVLRPIIDGATDWSGLTGDLDRKGYRLGFRDGRMLIVDDYSGEAISTGSAIGAPLSALSQRIGRPPLRMSGDGRSAVLHCRA